MSRKQTKILEIAPGIFCQNSLNSTVEQSAFAPILSRLRFYLLIFVSHGHWTRATTTSASMILFMLTVAMKVFLSISYFYWQFCVFSQLKNILIKIIFPRWLQSKSIKPRHQHQQGKSRIKLDHLNPKWLIFLLFVWIPPYPLWRQIREQVNLYSPRGAFLILSSKQLKHPEK